MYALKKEFLVSIVQKAVNENFYLLLNNRFLLFFRSGMGVFLREMSQKRSVLRL